MLEYCTTLCNPHPIKDEAHPEQAVPAEISQALRLQLKLPSAQEMSWVDTTPEKLNEWITLNVGGRMFGTTRKPLCQGQPYQYNILSTLFYNGEKYASSMGWDSSPGQDARRNLGVSRNPDGVYQFDLDPGKIVR